MQFDDMYLSLVFKIQCGEIYRDGLRSRSVTQSAFKIQCGEIYRDGLRSRSVTQSAFKIQCGEIYS